MTKFDELAQVFENLMVEERVGNQLGNSKIPMWVVSFCNAVNNSNHALARRDFHDFFVWGTDKNCPYPGVFAVGCLKYASLEFNPTVLNLAFGYPINYWGDHDYICALLEEFLKKAIVKKLKVVWERQPDKFWKKEEYWQRVSELVYHKIYTPTNNGWIWKDMLSYELLRVYTQEAIQTLSENPGIKELGNFHFQVEYNS